MDESARTMAMRNPLPLWRRLGVRLEASFLALTALGILLSGFLQYRAQDWQLRESLGALLLNIARTGALLVDGDQHEMAMQAGRNDSPEYEGIRKRLEEIQVANLLSDPIYTIVDVRGEMGAFGVISHGKEPVRKEYRLVPNQGTIRRVLADGLPAYTDIYSNEHGTWISGFAPIKDRTGRTVAVLDVDYRADVYLAALGVLRRQLYQHAIAGALIALLAGILLARQITRPVAKLAALARSVVEGDLTARVRITARDEIGMLANVFHLMVQRLQVSNRSMVEVLVRALEARTGEAGSLHRVAACAQALGERLDLFPSQREALEFGALFHDIGEIRTPEAILHKAGPLTPEERAGMQQHPAAGVEILETVPLLTPALDVVGAHHERYDGSGYPHGLKGEEIPLAARIFAVADALDAITHVRPYRRAAPVAEALAILEKDSGTHFDPRVADAALAIPPDRWAALLTGAANDEPRASTLVKAGARGEAR